MTTSTEAPADLEDLELDLLLEGVFRQTGMDFRQYARASIKRRALSCLAAEGLSTPCELLARVLRDSGCMARLIKGLVIHVTEMFRDPPAFAAIRQHVVPHLRTYPFARLWVAGCASGEEAYSLAILLAEEGLLARCRIYATDVSEEVLEKARSGVFPLSTMRQNTTNYLQAGGTADFSDYYTATHDHAILRPALRRKVLFSRHNLVSDGSFNEFHLILCRNVMIYFNRDLQERVHQLLYDSLTNFGMLMLGRRESLLFTSHAADYEPVVEAASVYRRKQ